MNALEDSNQLDIDAMRRTAAGDLEAFGEIIQRQQHKLVNFFRRLGASHDGAEDLAQETFLRLYQWRDRYRPTAKFATFLFTLARHAWVDWLRKQGRTVKLTGEEPPEEKPHPEVGSAATDLRLDVQAALAELSEKLRAVVALHVYAGLNYGEIAAVLEIPKGTVKSRMFHALRQLKELLGAET